MGSQGSRGVGKLVSMTLFPIKLFTPNPYNRLDGNSTNLSYYYIEIRSIINNNNNVLYNSRSTIVYKLCTRHINGPEGEPNHTKILQTNASTSHIRRSPAHYSFITKPFLFLSLSSHSWKIIITPEQRKRFFRGFIFNRDYVRYNYSKLFITRFGLLRKTRFFYVFSRRTQSSLRSDYYLLHNLPSAIIFSFVSFFLLFFHTASTYIIRTFEMWPKLSYSTSYLVAFRSVVSSTRVFKCYVAVAWFIINIVCNLRAGDDRLTRSLYWGGLSVGKCLFCINSDHISRFPVLWIGDGILWKIFRLIF